MQSTTFFRDLWVLLIFQEKKKSEGECWVEPQGLHPNPTAAAPLFLCVNIVLPLNFYLRKGFTHFEKKNWTYCYRITHATLSQGSWVLVLSWDSIFLHLIFSFINGGHIRLLGLHADQMSQHSLKVLAKLEKTMPIKTQHSSHETDCMSLFNKNYSFVKLIPSILSGMWTMQPRWLGCYSFVL